MKDLAKWLICCSYLSSSFSYGMQEGSLYRNVFSAETAEALNWFTEQRRTKLSSEGLADVNMATALFDLRLRDKDDEIAKYLIETFAFTDNSPELKVCWTKCYNSWKKANDIRTALAAGVERIDCRDERTAYQQAASKRVNELLYTVKCNI